MIEPSKAAGATRLSKKADRAERAAALAKVIGAASLGAEAGAEPAEYTHSALTSVLAYLKALHKNRFEGKWNWGVRALSHLPFGGRKNRKLMESQIADAEKLLAAHAGGPNTLDREVGKQVFDALLGADIACNDFDFFIDNVTECGTTILTGIGTKWWWEHLSARNEVKTGKRLEDDFKGEWLMRFPLQSAVYFATMAASRGQNFIKSVQPDLSLKTNWSWIIGEVIAIPIMVVGTNQGGKLIRKHSFFKDKKQLWSDLLASIPSGFISSYQCYEIVNRGNPRASGSGSLFAALRGAFYNTPMRFVVGGLLRGHEEKKANAWAIQNGYPARAGQKQQEPAAGNPAEPLAPAASAPAATSKPASPSEPAPLTVPPLAVPALAT